MRNRKKSNRLRRGSALVTSFGLMALVAVATVSYVSSATQTVRQAHRQSLDVQTSHLCEAGVQMAMRRLWRQFKIDQTFADIDSSCSGASAGNPQIPQAGEIDSVGQFASGVISVTEPAGDPFTRIVVIRSVGWIDLNGNGVLDPDEPQKIVDVSAAYQLSRSQVFDYTYFVNNYGWMYGFQPSWLIINGDMRANGDMEFKDGMPTVNGSIYAAHNTKLTPGAAGLVNDGPVKWANSNYRTSSHARMRPGYSSSIHGERGSEEYETWRDFIFDSEGSIVNNRAAGAVIADANGYRSWTRTSMGASPNFEILDTQQTEELVMPDLNDLGHYINLSQNFVDMKERYEDNSPNPHFGEGAWVKIYDPTATPPGYREITENGVLTGSAMLVGTSGHPILVHGPVTVTQDVVIKGFVQGQGTLYAGRNVHIVGSVRYKHAPDFLGANMLNMDRQNEKKDMLALAARGSVIMGNPVSFSNPYPLKYMTPPFTKGRYDEHGNWIAPYNANQVDYTGKKRYMSTFTNAQMNAVAEGINQVDAILYTNFVGGGNIGTGGGGVQFNGTLICKDEAMVVYSLPMQMNYDNRIRERAVSQAPLIDLQLPRSPVLLRSSWKDRGFHFGENHAY
jgi:hypothetical protein